MEQLMHILDTLRANPLLGAGAGVLVVGALFMLFRKPKIQREADARLAMLRRDKADQYTKQRPPG
jgi:hypothetical protein